MYIIVADIIGALPEESVLAEMDRYFSNHQNEDGGWGLHVEGPVAVFAPPSSTWPCESWESTNPTPGCKPRGSGSSKSMAR